jgi:hypothetical protein
LSGRFSSEDSFQNSLDSNGSLRKKAETKRKAYQMRGPKRGQTAKKTLKKSTKEQHSGYLWNRIGMSQGNVTGYGYLRDYPKKGNAADGFLVRKPERNNSYFKPNGGVPSSWLTYL